MQSLEQNTRRVNYKERLRWCGWLELINWFIDNHYEWSLYHQTSRLSLSIKNSWNTQINRFQVRMLWWELVALSVLFLRLVINMLWCWIHFSSTQNQPSAPRLCCRWAVDRSRRTTLLRLSTSLRYELSSMSHGCAVWTGGDWALIPGGLRRWALKRRRCDEARCG